MKLEVGKTRTFRPYQEEIHIMGIYMKNSRRIEKETSDLLERVKNMGIDTGVGKRLPIVYLLRVFFLFWF